MTHEPREPRTWGTPSASDPYARLVTDPSAEAHSQPSASVQPVPGPYGQPMPGQYGQPMPGQYGQPAPGPYGQPLGYPQPSDTNNVNAHYGMPMGGYPYKQAVPMRPSMGLVQAMKAMFRNYAKFDGRASLSEFWFAYLGNMLITFVLLLPGVIGILATNGDLGVVPFLGLVWLYGLAAIVPGLALEFRRLHDVNKSAVWLFISFVPMIGGIWLLILLASPSDPAGAQFDGPEQPRLGD